MEKKLSKIITMLFFIIGMLFGQNCGMMEINDKLDSIYQEGFKDGYEQSFLDGNEK